MGKNSFRLHVEMLACVKGQGLLSLKDESCAEHPVSHGEGDQQTQQKGQSPAGLRQSAHIGDGVEDPSASKEAEVKQSSRELRSSQSVEQADHHEGNNVLQVILVTPAQQNHTAYNMTNY